MAKKAFLKDHDDIEILPITRGELVLDSSGNPAFSSNEFLATTSQPGLMSKEDKSKIDNLSSIGELTDEKVKQIATTTNASYRLLFSGTADDTTRIEYTGKSSKLLYNPSTGYLTSTKFVGDLAGNADSAFAFKTISRHSAIDLNTALSGGGIATQYNTVISSMWANSPAGVKYGSVIQFYAKGDYKNDNSLNGQLLWDINHDSTTDTTRSLWWRAADGNGFTNSKWHQIAFTDSDITGSAARAKYIETMTYTGESWYGDKYKLYAKWFNGTICDWKSTDDTNNEYQVRVDIAKKLNTPRLLWGNEFDGTQSLSGTIVLTNNNHIRIKDTLGADCSVIGMTDGNNLMVGGDMISGSRTHSTYLYGYNIYFRTGANKTAMTITKEGNVNVAGGIKSGDKFILTTSSMNLGSATTPLYLFLARPDANYIWASANGGYINLGVYDAGATNSANATLSIYSDRVVSGQRNNAVSLGTSSYRWSNVYSVDGNFSGTITGNLDGTYVNALTGYTKATTISALADTDTLNTALGKLEYKADVAYNLVKGAYDGDGTIENLEEILRVLDGIKDTDTIQAIVGKYLPLTGGTVNGLLQVTSNINAPFRVFSTSTTTRIGFYNNGTLWGYFGFSGQDKPIFVTSGGVHQAILTSAGGTMTGILNMDSSLVMKGATETASRGIFFGTTAEAEKFRIRIASNKLCINDNEILHSGNVGEYALKTDGSNAMNAPLHLYYSAIDKYDGTFVCQSNLAGGAPFDYASVVNIEDERFSSMQLAWYRNLGKPMLSFRLSENGTFSAWKTIAFTDSNVASAQELITADNVKYAYHNGNNLLFGRSTTPTNIYGSEIKLRPNGTIAVLINSSGNVTIGSSDLAGTTHKLYVGGNIALPLNSSLVNPSGQSAFMVDGNGHVQVGHGTVNKSTYINGNDVALRYGSSRTTGLYLSSAGNVGIGTTSPAYKLDVVGDARATSFVKLNSSDSYLLLGDGGHKAISDFMLKSDELTNNLTTINKTLTVTKDWMDTGIKSTDLAKGTYIIQVSVSGNDSTARMWDCIWSGIMSWDPQVTNDDEPDEIILHRAGHAYANTIYIRTLMIPRDTSGVGLKLQIAANKNIGAAYTYTFKFKRVI